MAESADKVFVLVPVAESEEVSKTAGNVPRARGRPKKLVPTFMLAEGEMLSVHQVPADQVGKASSKQHIPVSLLYRFHTAIAKFR